MSDAIFPPDVRELLEQPNPAVITSVRPNGQPVPSGPPLIGSK